MVPLYTNRSWNMSCKWGEGDLTIPPDALPACPQRLVTWLTRLGWPPWSLYGTSEFPVAGLLHVHPSHPPPRPPPPAHCPDPCSQTPFCSSLAPSCLVISSLSSTSSTNFQWHLSFKTFLIEFVHTYCYFSVSCTLQRTIASKSSKSYKYSSGWWSSGSALAIKLLCQGFRTVTWRLSPLTLVSCLWAGLHGVFCC